MVLWINCLQNNSFINPTQLPLWYEKNWNPSHSATGSYGRQAGKSLGRQAFIF